MSRTIAAWLAEGVKVTGVLAENRMEEGVCSTGALLLSRITQFTEDFLMHTSDPIVGIQCKNSDQLVEPAGHYSHVCIAGGFVHISGSLPLDANGRAMSDQPFQAQVQRVLDNLDACLECAGVTRNSLVQVRIYLTNMDNWPVFNELYSNWIGEHRPARAVAGVASLHFDAGVEVEALALAP